VRAAQPPHRATNFADRRLSNTTFRQTGSKQLRLLTAEGMRNIDDALIICANRPRTVAEHLLVTVCLLTGEQVTGVVDVAKPAEFTESPPVAA
jgi:hypothetical protein